jgi:FlgD Ig-like domain
VKRLPALAFSLLVAATVAAFFITQHLKVSTPLIAGFPHPSPSVINPAGGVACYNPVLRKNVDHRAMTISFYLQNRSDRVDVYVVDKAGKQVATLALGRYMPGGSNPLRSKFLWNGREPDGSLAPDGDYYVRVKLIHQHRTVTISTNSGPVPVTVKTTPPKPVVTSVTPQSLVAGSRTPVRITYAGNESRGATVLIYRLAETTKRHRHLRHFVLVKSFPTSWKGQTASWDGTIRKLPAPPGRYLIGLQVSDAACNTGYFPASLPPAPGSASQAELTVRR